MLRGGGKMGKYQINNSYRWPSTNGLQKNCTFLDFHQADKIKFQKRKIVQNFNVNMQEVYILIVFCDILI